MPKDPVRPTGKRCLEGIELCSWPRQPQSSSEIFRVTNLDLVLRLGVMKRLDLGFGGWLPKLSYSSAPQRPMPVSSREGRYI